MKSVLHPRLVGLELARTLGLGATISFALVVGALALGEWSSPAGAALVRDHALAQRALAREAILAGALVVLAPWILVHAGGIVGRWRREEAAWLGARPAGRGALVASAWLGVSLAAASALVLVAGVLLARAGLGAPSWRFAGAHALAAPSVLGPGERRAFTLAEPAAGAARRLRVHLARTLGTGEEAGTPAEIEITAARADGGEHAIVARLATRARVEIELPPGRAPLEVTVAHRAGSSAALLDERTFELWSAGPREGWAVLEIALRAAIALAAGAALALGLGAWMSAPSAAALVLCAWACSTALDDARAWIPGARLVRDLEFLSAGRLCEAIDPRWIGGGAAIAIAGCALAALGLRSWSSPP